MSKFTAITEDVSILIGILLIMFGVFISLICVLYYEVIHLLEAIA